MNRDSFDTAEISEDPVIVPIWKRIVAFAMDMILYDGTNRVDAA